MNVVVNCLKKDIVLVGGPSQCSDVLVGPHGESITVTSACDLGVVCHGGVPAARGPSQGVALSQQAHVCSRFLRSLPSFSTVGDS